MTKRKKSKHNKKRNTAFLYETLVREATKCVLSGDKERRKKVVAIFREHFKKGTALYQEKRLYSALLETMGLSNSVAEKLLNEVKLQRSRIDDKQLFNEQTALIDKINKALNGEPFNNFVPDYKNLATVAQIFSANTDIKERVLLESKIVEDLSASAEEKNQEKLQSIDSLTYKTFVKKFNEQYGETLLPEQKDLITKYVMSFVDNGIELKYFLNEEIGRLKSAVSESIGAGMPLSDDKFMEEKANQVVNILAEMSARPIDEDMIKKILKVQQLISEVAETEANDG
jgi:hypothetical protein